MHISVKICIIQVDVAVVGSSLLDVLDSFAFKILPESTNVSFGNARKCNVQFELIIVQDSL